MKLIFEAEFGKEGLVYVTSRNVPGLVVSGGSLSEALRRTADGLNDLMLAHAIEIAKGNLVQPIIHL